MVESRGGLRFLLEAMEPVGIPRNKRRQNLDRYFALQRRVAGAVHFAHSACAQQAEHFIAIQFRACGERHGDADYIPHAKLHHEVLIRNAAIQAI
jgi:hypothetical protein